MNQRRHGFTLIEILISVICLAITLTGVMSLFLSGKRYILHSRARMSGTQIGKVFVDPLHAFVREDTWGAGNNALNPGSSFCDTATGHQQNPVCPDNTDRNLNNIEYRAEYNITAPFADTQIRKANITIRWNEPTP